MATKGDFAIEEPQAIVPDDDKSLKDKAIDIKGKNYVMVANRVIYFNDHYPDASITTEMLSVPEADTVMFKATVTPDGKRFFTGHSQATWGDGMVNKTAALENAETSAVGRALAFMGIGVIDSIASVDEIAKAKGPGPKDKTADEYADSFENPESRLPQVRWRALESACKANGHSSQAQGAFLATYNCVQWSDMKNKDFQRANEWASTPAKVPGDLQPALERSVAMANGNKCVACGSRMIPAGANKKTGKPYGTFCSNDKCSTRQRKPQVVRAPEPEPGPSYDENVPF